MSPKEKAVQLRKIQKALDLFPKIVEEKKIRYAERQKFLKETFGALVKQVRRKVKKIK
jgi:nitrate reductase assembly molybdenum cofactor insertion protein NarJ